MNNFIHEGHVIQLTAPYEVMAGDGLLCGSLFGIATSWAPQGDSVGITTAGVFDLKRRVDEQWEVGEPIYWNDCTRSFTREPDDAVMVGLAVSSTHGQTGPWVRGKLLGFAVR
jgi:predicted RecA/RadA family phage recombinase